MEDNKKTTNANTAESGSVPSWDFKALFLLLEQNQEVLVSVGFLFSFSATMIQWFIHSWSTGKKMKNSFQCLDSGRRSNPSKSQKAKVTSQ